jgi:hypothetical protein
MLTRDLELKDGCEDDEDPKDNWNIMMKFLCEVSVFEFLEQL